MSGHQPGQEHSHDPHPGMQPDSGPNYYAKRMRAIQALLVEKGVVTQEDIRRWIDWQDSKSPADGARLVARAWMDPQFKARLLADPKAAAAEVGLSTSGLEEVEFVVVENTEKVHHLVVCTLCSCYPRAILGRPPDWYKSLNYRSRAVVEPRAVLSEFGLELGDDVEVRVHDSTANMRYLVLPQRPPGTDHLSEEELARLVTRDSMIGVAVPRLEPAPTA